MANEVRLIDANALKEHKVTGEIGNLSGDFIPGFVIDTAPTVEVVHGHWISKGYKIECSVCGHRAFLGTYDPVLHTEEKNIRKYCHNCGAKMDGGNEDG